MCRELTCPSYARGLVTALCLTVGGVVMATGTPPELERLVEIFVGEVQTINAQYQAASDALPNNYRAQLETLEGRLQRTGDLDGMLQTRQERERFDRVMRGERDPFELVPEMPPDALVETPQALRLLQEQYIKNHRDEVASRQNRLDALVNAYVTRLEELQRLLTVRNRIDDALAVKIEIDRVKQQGAVAPPMRGQIHNDSHRSADNLGDDLAPHFGQEPNWVSWEFEGVQNFTQDGPLFGHPDIPDELSGEYRRRTGRGRIYGTCRIDRREVSMRDRHWFGKALVWRVRDLGKIDTLFHIESRYLSGGQNYGPSAQITLAPVGHPSASLSFPLIYRDITVRMRANPETRQIVLHWEEGRQRSLVEWPEGVEMQIILGISVRNTGEQCDTRISLR